jgi:uncharacterized coiled-coil protein SlyX
MSEYKEDVPIEEQGEKITALEAQLAEKDARIAALEPAFAAASIRNDMLRKTRIRLREALEQIRDGTASNPAHTRR